MKVRSKCSHFSSSISGVFEAVILKAINFIKSHKDKVCLDLTDSHLIFIHPHLISSSLSLSLFLEYANIENIVRGWSSKSLRRHKLKKVSFLRPEGKKGPVH